MTNGANRPRRSRLRGPQLIVYADRFGGTLKAVGELMRTRLAGVFDGVHILPFYVPFDGVDAGFDPMDHKQVDPRLGTWDDIVSLSTDLTVVADAIVNHMSAGSREFEDFSRPGRRFTLVPNVLDDERHIPERCI